MVFLVALVLVCAIVLAAVIVVRGRQTAAAQPAAEDCEQAKPKVEFAVAECDGGAAPAKDATGTTPAPAKH
jgi:hypothetical protein